MAPQVSSSTAEAEEYGGKISDNVEEITDWDKKNNFMVVFLQSNKEFEVILMLTLAYIAYYTCTQPKDRLD